MIVKSNEDTKQGHQKTHLVNGRGRWETQLEGRSPGALTERLQQKGVPGQIDGSLTVTKKRLPWQILYKGEASGTTSGGLHSYESIATSGV